MADFLVSVSVCLYGLAGQFEVISKNNEDKK